MFRGRKVQLSLHNCLYRCVRVRFRVRARSFLGYDLNVLWGIICVHGNVVRVEHIYRRQIPSLIQDPLLMGLLSKSCMFALYNLCLSLVSIQVSGFEIQVFN